MSDEELERIRMELLYADDAESLALVAAKLLVEVDRLRVLVKVLNG